MASGVTGEELRRIEDEVSNVCLLDDAKGEVSVRRREGKSGLAGKIYTTYLAEDVMGSPSMAVPSAS